MGGLLKIAQAAAAAWATKSLVRSAEGRRLRNCVRATNCAVSGAQMNPRPIV